MACLHRACAKLFYITVGKILNVLNLSHSLSHTHTHTQHSKLFTVRANGRERLLSVSTKQKSGSEPAEKDNTQ